MKAGVCRGLRLVAKRLLSTQHNAAGSLRTLQDRPLQWVSTLSPSHVRESLSKPICQLYKAPALVHFPRRAHPSSFLVRDPGLPESKYPPGELLGLRVQRMSCDGCEACSSNFRPRDGLKRLDIYRPRQGLLKFAKEKGSTRPSKP